MLLVCQHLFQKSTHLVPHPSAGDTTLDRRLVPARKLVEELDKLFLRLGQCDQALGRDGRDGGGRHCTQEWVSEEGVVVWGQRNKCKGAADGALHTMKSVNVLESSSSLTL
jgi:hypothetical protein